LEGSFIKIETCIKKVLVIGSGPIVIGQAAEFDYAGTQACKALKEEGIEVVLVNSNPATIMTDTLLANRVYIEPLTLDTIKEIIIKEKPDSLLPTLGGQTGLNLAVELAESGFLYEQNVKLLGTTVESIKKAEDRDLFKKMMQDIGEPVIESAISHNVESALKFASQVGYPVIVRPAYTLGGTGGGIADNPEELKVIVSNGLQASRVHQVLVEKSLEGYKEIEYEVVRDRKGNCIIVCNMENIDPVGIHTGDSIVVAPSLTLRDREYQMLRSASIKIINELKIEGGCNIQFALDPNSMKYYVIEVNPRVSRSSALASKATGYPIARVASKIALGYCLDEISNNVTGKTSACFEPALDYVVIKIPRWPFDKFVKADITLGTKMKATGEVMAIGSNFESALLKAVRSLELGIDSLELKSLKSLTTYEIIEKLGNKTHERLFIIAEALRRGISIEEINRKTLIDPYFLNKILNIVKHEELLKTLTFDQLDKDILYKCKKLGFTDNAIAGFLCSGTEDLKEKDICEKRKSLGIIPVYKIVDTCAAEFEAVSPYYYSAYGLENEVQPGNGRKKIVVIGSGPIRIGQGIEFDYCSVHSIFTLKKLGYEAVIINNNPETVSTDFDISDRLYFEPLTPEDVINVLDLEKPDGVIVQFGGQSAIKLAKPIHEAGFKIIGTQSEFIDKAEDRKEFDAIVESLGLSRPAGHSVFTVDEAVEVAGKLGYPVLVRPSYVLGGQGMEIAYNSDDIFEFLEIINRVKQEHPILVDKYLTGREIEIDAISDGEDILIPGIMEHIERAGIHSGDSISVYPSCTISDNLIKQIEHYTKKLVSALKVSGMINIQFVEYQGELYVIEVNPRSSRTVPYISKVTGVPMIELATKVMLGEKVRDLGYGTGLYPVKNIFAVKVPVFSFEKLPMVETCLGPEMKSTGEVLGIGKTLPEALYKGLIAAGFKLNKLSNVLITVADKDKQEAIPIAKELKDMGFKIFATEGTARVLNQNGISCECINKLSQPGYNIKDAIFQGKINIIINTPTKGRVPQRDGFKIRRMAAEHSVPCFTSLDTAKAFCKCYRLYLEGKLPAVTAINDI